MAPTLLLVMFAFMSLNMNAPLAFAVPVQTGSAGRLTTADSKYCVVHVDRNSVNSLTIGNCDDAIAFVHDESTGQLQTQNGLCVGVAVESNSDSPATLVGVLPCDSSDGSQIWHFSEDSTWQNDWELCLAYDSHETVDRLVQTMCTRRSVKQRFIMSSFPDDSDDDAVDN